MPIIPDINITTAGILKLLQNLDVHKATGPDQVSSRFLKETAESIPYHETFRNEHSLLTATQI